MEGEDDRTDEANGPDRSVVRECYWVLCGQFQGSEEEEDQVRSVLIAVSIATGVLAVAATASAILASTGNWPVALVLLIAGIGVLVVAWLIGRHRLDWIVIGDR
ncbi:MAG: hypothetical protein ABEH56_04960 [Salinirussus sp.]